MKKLAFEKFKNSVMSSSEMLKAITGGYGPSGCDTTNACNVPASTCNFLYSCGGGAILRCECAYLCWAPYT